MAGFGKRRRRYTSSEFGYVRSRGMGKISRRNGSASINSAKISDSLRSHRAGAASSSVSFSNGHRPRRRLLGGINQRALAQFLTVAAAAFVIVLGVVLIVTAANSGGRQLGDAAVIDMNDSDSVITADDTGATVTIALGGSIKLQDEVVTAAAISEGYDFNNYLSELRSVMSADVSIVSLSGTINKSGANDTVSGYPDPKYPSQLVDSLANIGVNYTASASGYTMNNGYDAMCGTVDALAESGITAVGISKTAETGSTICVRRVNSIAIGIGAYNCVTANELKSLQNQQSSLGYSSEQIASCVNQLDIEKASETILADVAAMRKQGAQFIIICINWGSSDLTAPNYAMRSLAQDMIDNGVDITLGYGSDEMQKITVKTYTDSEGSKKNCYVFYSLGNLFSDCGSGSTQSLQESMVINMTLERAAGSEDVSISAAYYHPIYINRDENYVSQNTYLKYRVVPAARYVDADTLPEVFSTEAQWTKCIQTFTDVRKKFQEAWGMSDYFVLGTVEKVDSVTDGSSGDNTSL